jgi:hypothetical protein
VERQAETCGVEGGEGEGRLPVAEGAAGAANFAEQGGKRRRRQGGRKCN